jgi:hypothetical protein
VEFAESARVGSIGTSEDQETRCLSTLQKLRFLIGSWTICKFGSLREHQDAMELGSMDVLVGDVGLDETEHLLGGLCSFDKDMRTNTVGGAVSVTVHEEDKDINSPLDVDNEKSLGCAPRWRKQDP